MSRKSVTSAKKLSYEQKLVISTVFILVFNFIAAVGKIVMGTVLNFMFAIVGIFGLVLMLGKLNCLLGIKEGKANFKSRNLKVSVCLIVAGVIYIVFMSFFLSGRFLYERYSQIGSILLAAVGFTELGIAIYGLVRTKNKGYYYRNLKIITFANSLTAILTAQIALLSAGGSDNTASGITGIAIGIITILLAVYVLIAPHISIIDREYNKFILLNADKNLYIPMWKQEVSITLYDNAVYGKYEYKAKITGNVVDGHIIKSSHFFKNLPIILKILFILLSEILVFVWLAGYVVHFCRTANMPQRLNLIMERNGFSKLI